MANPANPGHVVGVVGVRDASRKGRHHMDEISFQQKMAEIMDRIRRLPGEAPEGQNPDRREQVKTTVGELQDSLDFLRLSVKYLIFDLEATRRENAYLRKMVEQSNREAERRRSRDDDADERLD
jgi:hypothetical protein